MGCVYVAVSVAGVVKVGATKSPEIRLPGLKAAFRKFGDELKSIEFCEPISNFTGAEFHAICEIKKIARPYFGREWFEGIEFDVAVKLAKEATEEMRSWRGYKPLSKKQQEKQKSALIAQKAAAAEARELWKVAHAKEVMARKELRVKRLMEVAVVAAAQLARRVRKEIEAA